MSKRDFQEMASSNWTQSTGENGHEQQNTGRKRKRKSRWATGEDDKVILPTVIPTGLTREQEEQYIVQLQIEEISRRLRTGDLGIPPNPEDRSPSPEPIYNNEGKRLNTREYRTRKKLEEERHRLVLKAQEMNPDYKPPSDYKPPVVRVNDKVMIPQEEHPDINFVGLLIGPRGNTLKNLEKETGAKIIIRGKGSVKEGKIGRKDGQPLPGEDEPLHAYVTANNPEHVKKAVEKIKEIIRQGIEVPEGQNDLRRQQLRELALLNGTLRENDALGKLKQIQQAQTIITNTIICSLCGGTGHIAQDCKSKKPGDTFRQIQNQSAADKAKMDSEYMSLMAELGEGPPPKQTTPMSQAPTQTQHPPQRPPFAAPPPMTALPPSSPWQQPPPTSGGAPPGMPSVRMPPSMVGPPHNGPGQPPVSIPGSQPLPMMGVPPPMSSTAGPVPPPWSQPHPHVISSAPPTPVSMAVPSLASSFRAPPPNLLAPPPPPPPSTQATQFQPPTCTPQFPWQQQQPPQQAQQPPSQAQSFGVPPPPPVTQSLPPWQQQPPQTTVAPVPPPPPSSIPPWQQAQQLAPPPLQGQPPPVASPVIPPPPPPGSQPGITPVAPPPPPPGGEINSVGMPSSIPLGVPPPPPPN